MTSRDWYRTPEELPLTQPPYLKPGREQSSAKTPPPFHTAVRSPEQIPENVLDYFQVDPRTRHPLKEETKVLFSQVFCHEIEEGARLLTRSDQEKDAKVLADFNNRLHPNQRLDLLRKRLESAKILQSAPQRVNKALKARNNQWGAVKAKIGNHPAVAFTEVGVGYKECNEDAFLLMPEQKVLALSDGMGGHYGGNVASCMAIDFFEYATHQGYNLEDAITLANQAILIRCESDPRLGGKFPMGCTFAAIQLRHSLLKIAHVGDTKIMVVRSGSVLVQSEDHTKGQELLRDGLIDPTTAFELNHIVTRCLGLDAMQARRDVSLQNFQLEPGDRVILMTDGITDNFYDNNFNLNEIVDIVAENPLPNAADIIVDLCHQRMTAPTLPNGRETKADNISLALLEYRG